MRFFSVKVIGFVVYVSMLFNKVWFSLGFGYMERCMFERFILLVLFEVINLYVLRG